VAEGSWPDERLVLAAQGGDVDSLAALVSASHPNVRRFAHSLCATPEDAQDAAQEALIILYRKIGSLRASGALASWMFRIVRNECLRRARAVGRGPVPLGPTGGYTGDGPGREPSGPSAEEEFLQRLEAGRVADAIAGLPADQRRVLVMRDVQGLGGRAVAEALGIGTAAMKSRLHRARTAVRTALAEPVPAGAVPARPVPAGRGGTRERAGL
jgi:RNA polymerase sigma factor (sigma-70 family)